MNPERLVTERWFAGKGRPVARVSTVAELGELCVLEVEYADGAPGERYLDLREGLRWADLLDAVRMAPLESAGGRLTLRPGSATERLLDRGDGTQRVASLDQSNTGELVGGRLIVKAYRRLRRGRHPEAETLAALDAADAPVPAFAGVLVLTEPDGEETTLALLQEFVPGAAAGWEMLIASVAAHLRGDGGGRPPALAPAGEATAALHEVLAARLGVERGACSGAAPHPEAIDALQAAREVEPSLDATMSARIAERLAPLQGMGDRVRQRIHGDLNLAQLLFTADGVLIVDFEGNPTIALARRLLRDEPLRDVATLLRSVDHVASAAARRAEGRDPTAWIDATRAEILTAYERRSQVDTDHAVLHALELVAECRELVYAHRVVPEWAYAARSGLARLLSAPAP